MKNYQKGAKNSKDFKNSPTFENRTILRHARGRQSLYFKLKKKFEKKIREFFFIFFSPHIGLLDDKVPCAYLFRQKFGTLWCMMIMDETCPFDHNIEMANTGWLSPEKS